MSFKVKVDHWDCVAVGGHIVTSKPGALAGFVLTGIANDPTFSIYNGTSATTAKDNEIYPTDIHDISAHEYPFQFLPPFLIPAPDGIYVDVTVLAAGSIEFTIFYVED
jgi:hypothetical protein